MNTRTISAYRGAMPDVVQIGAGAIGRGFLAPFIAAAGHSISFHDASQPVIDALRALGQYTVSVGGEEIAIRDLHIVNSINERDTALNEMVQAQTIITSVGPNILPKIAPSLAEAVNLRMMSGIEEPLNFIFLENLPIEVGLNYSVNDQLAPFKAQFFSGRDEQFTDYVSGHVGFSRAIGNYPAGLVDGDILRVSVSGHDHYVPVDGKTYIGESDVPQIKLVKNYDALVCQKLFQFNMAHALVSYLGFFKGFTDTSSAMGDRWIRRLYEGAMEESGAALEKKLGIRSADIFSYTNHTTGIFTSYPDTVFRVGGDPFRKLSPSDRLLGAARLCLDAQITPNYIAAGIAAGINYALNVEQVHDPKVVFPADIAGPGERYEWVLREICGFKGNDPLASLVIGNWHTIFEDHNVRLSSAAQNAKPAAPIIDDEPIDWLARKSDPRWLIENPGADTDYSQ